MAEIRSGISLNEILSELKNAISWVESLGVSNFSSTRFGAYQKALGHYLVALPKTNPEVLVTDDLVAASKVLQEIGELMLIFSGLSPLGDQPYIRRRVQEIFKGPIYLDEETPENSDPRNKAFELALAARFLNQGYQVDLNNKADLVCAIEGKTVFVECKRPGTEKAIRKNVKKAHKQLQIRYANNANKSVKGLIAIDVSKAIHNMGSGHFFCADVAHAVNSNLNMIGLLTKRVKMIQFLPKFWDKRSIAVVVRSSYTMPLLAQFNNFVTLDQYEIRTPPTVTAETSRRAVNFERILNPALGGPQVEYYKTLSRAQGSDPDETNEEPILWLGMDCHHCGNFISAQKAINENQTIDMPPGQCMWTTCPHCRIISRYTEYDSYRTEMFSRPNYFLVDR